jgi:hypothetical protein
MHGNLDSEQFMSNTFTNNGVLVALAPGDGLMLEKVAYDKYNEHNTEKKSEIMIQRVTQDEELIEYRKSLVCHIARRELETKAYTTWLSWFDDNCSDYYIKAPGVEEIKKMRNVSQKPQMEPVAEGGLSEYIPYDLKLHKNVKDVDP